MSNAARFRVVRATRPAGRQVGYERINRVNLALPPNIRHATALLEEEQHQVRVRQDAEPCAGGRVGHVKFLPERTEDHPAGQAGGGALQEPQTLLGPAHAKFAQVGLHDIPQVAGEAVGHLRGLTKVCDCGSAASQLLVRHQGLARVSA
jgi:hypothetical protein